MDHWLNKTVKDTVNGFTGVVTAYAVYNNGKEMILLECIGTTGRPIEWWIDTQYAEIVE